MQIAAIARRALVLGVVAVPALAASPAGAAVFSYKVPNGIDEVVVAADGAVWLADGNGSEGDPSSGAWAERRGLDGSVRRVDIGESLLGGLFPAPDGSVWAPRLTEGGTLTYHRILPSGEMRLVSNEPSGLKTRFAGVDGTGAAWLTGWDAYRNHVLRMSPDGSVEDRGFWENSGSLEGNWKWSLGPDGNLWESGSEDTPTGERAFVARLTTSGGEAGRVTMFSPDMGPEGDPMKDLARQPPLPGPAGALWSLTGEFLFGIKPDGEISRVPLQAGTRYSLSRLATRPGAPLWAVHAGFATLEDSSSGEWDPLGAVGTVEADGTFRGLACLPKRTVAMSSATDQTGAALVLIWHTEQTDTSRDRLTWLYRVEPGTAPGTGCPVDPGPLAVKVLGPAIGPSRFGGLKFRVHVNRASDVSFARGKITIGSGRSARRFGFAADGFFVRAEQTRTVRGFGQLRAGFGGERVARAIKAALRRGKRVRLCLRAKAYHNRSGTGARRDWCGRVRRP